MPPDASQLADSIAALYESALGLGGLWLLWTLGLSPAARARAGNVRLGVWPITAGDFMLFLGLVVWGGLLLSTVARQLTVALGLSDDGQLVVVNAAFQLGLLAGAGTFYLRFDRRAGPPAAPPGQPWKAGGATFLTVLPLVMLSGFVWQNLLNGCGYPVAPQPMVDLMGRSGPPWQRLVTIVFAVVIAPVTEELVFRAGIFRYVRTRLPRWAALLLPAILFAEVHADLPSFVPLLVLGLVFSLAYERTGSIKTTMVAHALFNLNTTLLVLVGVNG
jgi:hypothetical protein